MNKEKIVIKDAKKVFRKKGACSHTLFYLLNREFGHLNADAERATDPLAGGILQQGYQCGMLWGSVMALGAESFRENKDHGIAVGKTISVTQHVMRELIARTKSANCFEITECDWTNKFAMAKFMLTGKFLSCFRLVSDWTPEAIHAVREGLSEENIEFSGTPVSCASEVIKRMGGSEEEAVMVAGLAGGMGLSGNACGALGAAIWMNTLKWCRENPNKNGMKNPDATKTLEAFQRLTDYEMLCSEISGQSFNTIDEHTEFIRNGGCKDVIEALVL